MCPGDFFKVKWWISTLPANHFSLIRKAFTKYLVFQDGSSVAMETFSVK